ncbi:MAG: dUTP diphosphatase [Patescibacteria group bacterium]|jgi:dUTP pyrophosphatase
MKTIQVKKLFPDAIIPARATNGAVGFDVYAYGVLDIETKEYGGELPYVLDPGQKILIGVGVAFASPWPVECQVRPRSGLANKYGIELGNSPGTVDPDFRGNVGVLLRNRSDAPFVVTKGMRIAQLIFSEVQIPVFEEVSDLPPTRRGAGGFGSTGLSDISEGTEAYRLAVIERDVFYMKMAIAASDRSTCVRGCIKDAEGRYLLDKRGRPIGQTRKFGCVIVKEDNVVSFGFNAQAPGMPACLEVGCLREAEGIPSGMRIERCRAVHAEEMAFLKMLVSGVASSTLGATAYVTAEPCEVCAKTLAGSGIDTLVVMEGVYPNNGIQIVKNAGINLRFVPKAMLVC